MSYDNHYKIYFKSYQAKSLQIETQKSFILVINNKVAQFAALRLYLLSGWGLQAAWTYHFVDMPCFTCTPYHLNITASHPPKCEILDNARRIFLLMARKTFRSFMLPCSCISISGVASLIKIIILLPQITPALEERAVFSIPLPRLTVRFSNAAVDVEEVFISYGQSMEGYAISNFDDRYVSISPRKRTDFFHKEERQFAYLLTEFEAQQLSRVCNSFLRTLNILERDLQAQRWNRCLHLDGALPRFMQGFYYLVTAARCSKTALPTVTCIPDSLCADSSQSDRRIRSWRSDPERVIKLRVAIKELIYQIRQWQKSELDNPKRDKWAPQSGNFERAYELFVKRYFGIFL